MKKIYLFLIVAFLSVAQTNHCQSQTKTIVTKAWDVPLGHPTVIDKYVTGTSDIENGIFYIVGNIYTTGEQENFFILKMNADDGSVVWQKDYSGYSDSRDFALDVATKGDYVYMTGLSWDSASSHSIITTFKLLASTGDTAWTARYSGSYNGYNAAADIVVDDTGFVYIGGTEQSGAFDFGMVVLKYDSNGNELFHAQYDSTYMYDAAVALALDPGKTLGVVGFSGTGFSSWDFVTVNYDPQTGTQQSYNRYGNGSGNFSQPVGISKDNLDQTYIAGTAAHSGQTDIKLIAYDSLMSQLWVDKWGDSTLNEEAVAFENDFNGNFFIGGTQTKANGGKDIVLLKYDKNSGSLIWSSKISATDSTKEASCKAIANDGNGGCYLTGRMNNGTDFDIATAHIDADGNLEWLKTFNRGAGTNDNPDDVEYDDNGGVIVTATSMGGDTVYLMLKYKQAKAFMPTDSIDPNTAYAFYRNNGQITYNDTLHTKADSVLYYTNAGSPQLYLSDMRLSYVMSHENTDSIPFVDTTYRIDMEFSGRSKGDYDPEENFNDAKTNAFLNYYLGYLPEAVTNVEGYNRIVRKRVYEHIDWEVCSTVDGIKNYFVVGRNGDANDIHLLYSGADSISILGDSMQLFIAGNYIQFAPLSAYSVDTNGTATPVGIHFDSLGIHEYGFVVDSFEAGDILVVEENLGNSGPRSGSDNLDWCTYYGGRSSESGNDVKTDAAGNVFMTGNTVSIDFPILAGATYDSTYGGGLYGDGFLVKFNANGSRAWTTYYGGSYVDASNSVATTLGDDVYICGEGGFDLPTKDLSGTIDYYDTASRNPNYGYPFIASFSNSNGTLLWGTLYSGTLIGGYENFEAVEYNPNTDEVCIVGEAGSLNWPTYDPGGATVDTVGLGCVVKILNSNKELLWATRFGINGVQTGFTGLAFDSQNNLYVVGGASNVFTPLHSGLQYTQNYGSGHSGSFLNGVLLRFDASNVLNYSTYFGGLHSVDFTGIAIDSHDNIFVCGYSDSVATFTTPVDYPTKYDASAGFNDTTFGGGGFADGIIAKFDHNLNLKWSSYVGTDGDEIFHDIIIAPDDKIYLLGEVSYYTSTPLTPLSLITPSSYYTQPWSGKEDCFIARFDNSRDLDWQTYFGGDNGNEQPRALTQYGNNYLYITGATNSYPSATRASTEFPIRNLAGAYNQGTLNLNFPTIGSIQFDAFLGRFNLNGVTGIHEISKSTNGILLYPNPAGTTIYVQISEAKGTVEIFDVLGQLVNTSSLSSSSPVAIDISNFSVGYYAVRINTEGNIYSAKFVKQ